jgi:UDP-N-acetylmuramyl pentapeptide phosphotransferase/UDP-N-acetylglucosamine-1-phosphate transferase
MATDLLSGTPVALGLASAALSFALVGLVRRVAVRQDLLDHPNERSSHSVATPRGGGLGLVASVVVVTLAATALVPERGDLVALVGLVAVAAVGWLDDRRGVPVRRRLVVHTLAAGLVGLLAIVTGRPVALASLIFLWWAFWTVSSINVVNFMDGINGLVASQVLVFALSLGLLLQDRGASAALPFTVAGASVGFLPWNFPRARIFLGDVGSGALGYAIAWLGVVAVQEGGVDLVRAYLPLLPLFADATTTLYLRWRDGERLTSAHRRHLYQRLANGGMGHTRVTLLYAAAAVAGSVIAHNRGPGSQTARIAGFVVVIGIVGLLLDRRARMPR